MDDKSEALCKIAVTALNALVASTEHSRHRELWKLALARVQQTRRDIESDEAIPRRRTRRDYSLSAVAELMPLPSRDRAGN